jgi:hypothetical protein
MAPSPDQPDLQEFIRQHATSYNPDTDTYRRPPFAQPVKAGKNSPIYNARSYHLFHLLKSPFSILLSPIAFSHDT